MVENENKLRSGVIGGLALIAIGTLIFLDNLRIISINIVDLFWPVILGIWGVSGLVRSRRLADAIWPGTMLVAAVLLLMGHVGRLHISLWTLWPLALIASGLTALSSEIGIGNLRQRFLPGTSSLSSLNEVAIFSGIKRRIETPAFEGGRLSAVFGGIEIDLRRASLSTDAVIDASAVFGGIEIRVPEEWRVALNGFAMFGGYEDKSLPPRPEPGFEPPVLTITGNTMFGGVSVRN